MRPTPPTTYMIQRLAFAFCAGVSRGTVTFADAAAASRTSGSTSVMGASSLGCMRSMNVMPMIMHTRSSRPKSRRTTVSVSGTDTGVCSTCDSGTRLRR